MPIIPLAEWLARGRELFGDDPLQWRFTRPAATPPQSMEPIALPAVPDKQESFVRVGERKLDWADRIFYLAIFLALVYAAFFMEGK